MSAPQTLDFQIRKTELSITRLITQPQPDLQDRQVLLQIESFALTSNNITYAAFGDAMNYWGFYPVTPESGEATSPWGRIPVWGFATVTDSRTEGIAVGEKFYGYYPMASSVVLTPTRVSPTSFVEAAPHRAALAAVYNQYVRCSADPFYTPDTENVQSLLRPLFITSWLIDDFLADNSFFGTIASGKRPVMLLSSASSKTAYGTAFQLAQRPELDVVGLTSPGNIAFCESLGCYSRVLSYDQLDQIATDTPMVYVDFAGRPAPRRAHPLYRTGLQQLHRWHACQRTGRQGRKPARTACDAVLCASADQEAGGRVGWGWFGPAPGGGVEDLFSTGQRPCITVDVGGAPPWARGCAGCLCPGAGWSRRPACRACVVDGKLSS
jgi:hypothetical protein